MAKSKKPPVPFYVEEHLLVGYESHAKKPLKITVNVHAQAEQDILDQQCSQLFAPYHTGDGILFKPIGFIDYHEDE